MLLKELVSHPLVALFSAIMMCILGAGIVMALLGKRQFTSLKVFSVNAGLAGLFSLLLSAPYWWPVFALQDLVNIDAAKQGYFITENHVVYFSQFFSRAWSFGFSVPGTDDSMSFQLGLPHFLFAMVGAMLDARRVPGARPLSPFLCKSSSPRELFSQKPVPSTMAPDP